MDDVAVARLALPSMPAEVFDDWLAPLVADRAWPFSEGADKTSRTVFAQVLWGKKLSWWAELQWELVSVPHGEIVLDPRSQHLAEATVRHVCGAEKMTIPPEAIEHRFRRALRYIDEHHRLPRPVVAVVQHDASWRLADGHHRFAALMLRDQQKLFPVDC